jgi:uracil-DNA glycosylase
MQKMQGYGRKPIVGNPVKSKIILIGQAPGIKEGDLKKPFAWTAGKNMFKWFSFNWHH